MSEDLVSEVRCGGFSAQTCRVGVGVGPFGHHNYKNKTQDCQPYRKIVTIVISPTEVLCRYFQRASIIQMKEDAKEYAPSPLAKGR